MPLAKHGKPVAGVSAMDKARHAIESWRAANEGYAQPAYTVVADNGFDKTTSDYYITVRSPAGFDSKAIVPSVFLSKDKKKLCIPEMGVAGAKVYIRFSETTHNRLKQERGVSVLRAVTETNLIVESM